MMAGFKTELCWQPYLGNGDLLAISPRV